MELSQLRDILINEYDPDRTRTGEAEIEALDLLTARLYMAAYTAFAQSLHPCEGIAEAIKVLGRAKPPLHWIARVAEVAYEDYRGDDSRPCWLKLREWIAPVPSALDLPELPWL